MPIATSRPSTRPEAGWRGGEANDESGAWGIDISGDGRCVAFASFASNLVEGDDNGRPDLFLARLP
jgi:hypothetical protein